MYKFDTFPATRADRQTDYLLTRTLTIYECTTGVNPNTLTFESQQQRKSNLEIRYIYINDIGRGLRRVVVLTDENQTTVKRILREFGYTSEK